MNMLRWCAIRTTLLILFFFGGVVLPIHADTPDDLIKITNITKEFDAHPNQLLLVVVSQKYCIACKRLEKFVLRPLIKSKKYAGQVMFREIRMDGNEQIVNFSGQTTSTKQFLKPYNVITSPTLLFLNARGKEVHPAMVGLGIIDYYSYYVEKSIDQSLSIMRNDKM